MTVRPYLAALLMLPLMASCQTMPTSADDAGALYVARGNEPGWILKMNGTSIAYEGDYGDTKITIPAPPPRSSFNGMRHVADRLTVDITYSACTDDMSGKRFADTVSVVADGKQVSGCGGRALPPESLDGTTWRIVEIDQMSTTGDVATELIFANGRITGTAGCNRFSGAYSASGNMLSAKAVATTRKMCPEKQMAQEAKFLAVLSGKVTTRYSFGGDLVLTDDKGNHATLRQVP